MRFLTRKHVALSLSGALALVATATVPLIDAESSQAQAILTGNKTLAVNSRLQLSNVEHAERDDQRDHPDLYGVTPALFCVVHAAQNESAKYTNNKEISNNLKQIDELAEKLELHGTDVVVLYTSGWKNPLEVPPAIKRYKLKNAGKALARKFAGGELDEKYQFWGSVSSYNATDAKWAFFDKPGQATQMGTKLDAEAILKLAETAGKSYAALSDKGKKTYKLIAQLQLEDAAEAITELKEADKASASVEDKAAAQSDIATLEGLLKKTDEHYRATRVEPLTKADRVYEAHAALEKLQDLYGRSKQADAIKKEAKKLEEHDSFKDQRKAYDVYAKISNELDMIPFSVSDSRWSSTFYTKNAEAWEKLGRSAKAFTERYEESPYTEEVRGWGTTAEKKAKSYHEYAKSAGNYRGGR